MFIKKDELPIYDQADGEESKPVLNLTLGIPIDALPQNKTMKGKYWVAAGLAVIGAAVYFWLKRKSEVKSTFSGKENERHHLTNVFSKAKQVAVGQ
jgi:hypothetical protein